VFLQAQDGKGLIATGGRDMNGRQFTGHDILENVSRHENPIRKSSVFDNLKNLFFS
jgi:hypothetical protein